MSTLTIYAGSVDNTFLYGSNATYLTARSTYTGASAASTAYYVGQQANFTCYENIGYFDTSPVPDGATVTAVAMSLWPVTDASGDDFDLQVREHAWGVNNASTVVTSAAWVAGASLSGKTLLASVSSAGIATGQYVQLSSQAAFASAINKTGNTKYIIVSSRQVAGTPTPTQDEYVHCASPETTGTTNDPKLLITYPGGDDRSFLVAFGLA